MAITGSSEFAALETLAVHVGRTPDPASAAVAPPIVLSTTFEREADGSFRSGYIYTRESNPNRAALEECVARLEGGTEAAAFASGLAAAQGVLSALSPQDHVVAPLEMYHGVRSLLKNVYSRWGLQCTFADMTDIQAVETAVRPNTKLVWMESPSNPTVKLTDIAAVAAIAHKAGAVALCDNTWSPLIQRPFELGCDLVLHSATKYFGGHSDVLTGLIVTKTATEFFGRIRFIQNTGGAVPSPFDCWLVLRSLSTLPHRMRAHCANALRVAEFLASHPNVETVHYPGLPGSPYHSLALRQTNALGEGLFGGMVSAQIRGGEAEAMKVAAQTRLFTRATSLGGVESLIEHRASVEGADSPTPKNLLRLSVGLEHSDDLIRDLAQALDGL